MRTLTNNPERFNKLVANGDFKAIYNLAKELDAKGNTEGTLMLSSMYHNGDYVKQDHKKEVKLLRKATKMGSLQSKFNLALAFAAGKGVKQSTSKSMSMMKQLAEDGFDDAIDFLYGECECEACIAERESTCTCGCDAGNLVKCGESLEDVMKRFTSFMAEGYYRKAFDLATEIHEWGYVQGTFALSIMYHNGQGVRQDFKKEVELLEIAVEEGFEPAIFNLAIALTLGKGIKQDAELGFEMICDLADAGYEDALDLVAA